MAYEATGNAPFNYTIGSEKGINFVNSAAAGQTMTGGDGSKWTKLFDGRTRIDNGVYTWYYGNPRELSSGSLDDYGSIVNELLQVTNSNSAKSAQNAADLRLWQEQQNKVAMEFNAQQAALNREWQEYLSNTAHQREVADLKAAGLNPILSATGGNGAAVTSGATASGVTSAGAKGEVDTSADMAIVSMLGTMLQMENQINLANINAQNNLAVADKYNAASELVAQISGAYGLKSAQTSANASIYASDISLERLARELKWNEEHPNNIMQGLNALLNGLLGNNEGSPLGGLGQFGLGILQGAAESGKKFENWIDGVMEDIGKVLFGDYSSTHHNGKY